MRNEIALGLAIAVAWAGGVCHAQETQGTDDRMRQLEERLSAQDEEIRQLREAVGAIQQGGAPPAEAGGEEDLESLLQGIEEELPPEPAERPPESTVQQSPNVFNPAITVFGDFLGRLGLNSRAHWLHADPADPGSPPIDNRANLREAELDLRADVDPYASGVVIVSYDSDDPGNFLDGDVFVEEGYVQLNVLPWGLVPRIGRFHTSFGRINVLHQHDLPQPGYPLPVELYLAEESYVDQGVSLAWLVPNPWVHLTLTGEVVNGNDAEILAGADSMDFAYIGRASLFQELGENFSVEAGASGLIGRPERGTRFLTDALCGDLMLRWKPRQTGTYSSFIFQAEAFYIDLGRAGRDAHPFGAYAYAQLQTSRNWYFGVRGDYAETLADDGSYLWRTGGYVSYYFTEFLRLRLAYEHTEYVIEDPAERRPPSDGLILQLTFVFGAHPTEPYWVNR